MERTEIELTAGAYQAETQGQWKLPCKGCQTGPACKPVGKRGRAISGFVGRARGFFWWAERRIRGPGRVLIFFHFIFYFLFFFFQFKLQFEFEFEFHSKLVSKLIIPLEYDMG